MPLYEFECEPCGVTEEFFASMAKGPPKGKKCRSCESPLVRVWSSRVDAFKTYTENNMQGGPVEITTKEQRDRLCREQNVSYDTFSNLKHKSGKASAMDNLSYKQVADTILKELGHRR